MKCSNFFYFPAPENEKSACYSCISALNCVRTHAEPRCVVIIKKDEIMANPPNNRGGKPQQRNNGPRPNNARPVNSAPKVKKTDDDGEGEIEMEGVVSAVLAGTMFRVKVANGHEFLAHISGKMRKRFIRLVVGDRVRIEVSPYDMTKARITFRLN